MKAKSAEILKNYIQTHKLNISEDKNKYNEFSYMDLYRIYSSLEIFSLEDLLNSSDDFKKFVLEHFDIFSTNQQSEAPIDKIFNKACMRIKYYSRYKRQKSQKILSELVRQLSPTKNGIILDVGAGEMPYSSLFLAQTNPTYAMDKFFVLSDSSLKRLSIHPVHKYFNNNTPVDNYDFVVGRFPCTAIEHIVSQCSKHNKPYFIQLCDCNLPETDKNGQPITEWNSILYDIDHKINFFQDYAFNLDATSSQVAKTYLATSLQFTDSKSTITISYANPNQEWTSDELLYEK